jgi:hypothetical protein
MILGKCCIINRCVARTPSLSHTHIHARVRVRIVVQSIPVSDPDDMLRFGAHVTTTTHVDYKGVAAGSLSGGAGKGDEAGMEQLTESVLLQVDSEHAASSSSRLRQRGKQSSKAGGSQHTKVAPQAVPMACECASWGCHCSKDCVCKMRAETFSGERLGPKSPLAGIADVTPDFQCTCDTTETGGPNPAAGGSIDCDCAEASCRCERRCACSPKA